MSEPDPAERDDPVEGGALDEGGAEVERPPTTDEPTESGALADEE
jgi:hypothetical protein